VSFFAGGGGGRNLDVLAAKGLAIIARTGMALERDLWGIRCIDGAGFWKKARRLNG
jgi:hypothetical protein